MEARLLEALPSDWVLHHRVPRPEGSRYEIDLALADIQLAVEIDGLSHRYTTQKAIDRRRGDFLMSRGWRVIRITNEEVRTDLEAVVAFITTVAARPASQQEAAPW
jgi:very-short-patch-repair endonuclease